MCWTIQHYDAGRWRQLLQLTDKSLARELPHGVAVKRLVVKSIKLAPRNSVVNVYIAVESSSTRPEADPVGKFIMQLVLDQIKVDQSRSEHQNLKDIISKEVMQDGACRCNVHACVCV